MIERYTLPAMGGLWTEQAKYERWLAVEMAATEAQAEMGYIPVDVPEKIKEKAVFDVARIEEIEAEVHHDVLAFLTNLSESTCPPRHDVIGRCGHSFINRHAGRGRYSNQRCRNFAAGAEGTSY